MCGLCRLTLGVGRYSVHSKWRRHRATAPGDGLFIAELTRHFWWKDAQCNEETLASWQNAAHGDPD
jgi:hypothetical protein